MQPRVINKCGNRLILIIFTQFFNLQFLLAGSTYHSHTISCCNGGVPYAIHVDSYSSLIFRPINVSGGEPDCKQYSVQESEKVDALSAQVACRCKSGYSGDKCERRNEALNEHQPGEKPDDSSTTTAQAAGENYSSFKIFLFIAIIPLSFALLAGIGAFLCRMCFCDCFSLHDYCKRCWSKDPDNLESDDQLAEEALMNGRITSYRFQVEENTQTNQERFIAEAEQNSYSDPPPAFDLAKGCVPAAAGGINQTVINVQPTNVANVNRKVSPPPPYADVVGQSSYCKDVSTQTVNENK